MNKSIIIAIALLATAGAGPLMAQQAVSAEELSALRAQLAALQERLTQLEQAQSALNTELQDSIDRTSDNLARTVGEGASSGWLGRWVWKGDLRMRNEQIDQEATASPRNRNRIRLRVGATARVNDNTRVELQFATTEGGDARSSNQSLTDANSRKALDLDLAYVEWSPTDAVKVSAGKMRYPWVRTSSYFFDNDINPEGVALNWQPAANGVFASAFFAQLAERATAADSGMLGAQLGWRGSRSDGSRVLLALAYYDHLAVQGFNPFQGASSSSAGLGSFGNSTTTDAALCRRALASGAACLANDFNVIELLGEYQFNLGEQPLLVYANWAKNTAADYSIRTSSPATTIPAGLDTAYAIGLNYGRANATIPGTWEVGYIHQIVEKDALFGQWIDSDFASGNTDGGGGALRAAYQFSRNWRFNISYMLNETNRDVAAAVTLPTARTLRDREYQRLQVDFNWTY